MKTSARLRQCLAAITVLTVTILPGSWAHAATPPQIALDQFTSGPGGFSPVSGGAWNVAGGVYTLTTPATAATGNGNVSIEKTPVANTADWVVSVDVTPGAATSEYSLIYDYSDPQNYSYAHFSTVMSDFSQGVWKVAGGNVTQIAAFNAPVSVTAKTTAKIKYESGKVKVYQGSTYLTGVAAPVRNGALTGIGSSNSAATFDNFTINGTKAATTVAPLAQVTPAPAVQPPAAPTTCNDFQAARTIAVSTAAGLTSALASAQPGDDIQLVGGTYAGNFSITSSGTASQPIRLTGPDTAILDAGSVDGSPVLRLNNASYWCVNGLTLTNGNKGIMSDTSSNNVLQNLSVHHIGDEAVHFRSCSSNNVLSGSSIHDTGLRRDSFGEGVYIGTADSNWGVYNYCDLGNPDKSNYNRIIGNTIYNTGAENIDVKEGTSGGLIQGNRFEGTGMTGNHADSLMDIKGADYQVLGNTGVVSGASAVIDGFQTHVINVRTDVTRSGTGIVFSGNTLTLGNATGYGINIGNGGTALVTCDNVVTGAALGMSNTPCRP